MSEIYAALIGVLGALLLAYVQRRWERRSIGSQWEKRTKELDERLERAHADRIRDLQGTIRDQAKQIRSLTGGHTDDQ